MLHEILKPTKQALAFQPTIWGNLLPGPPSFCNNSSLPLTFRKIVNHSSDHTSSESVAIYFHQETSFVLNTSSAEVDNETILEKPCTVVKNNWQNQIKVKIRTPLDRQQRCQTPIARQLFLHSSRIDNVTLVSRGLVSGDQVASTACNGHGNMSGKFSVNSEFKLDCKLKWKQYGKSKRLVLVRNNKVNTIAGAQIDASNNVLFFHAKDLK